MDFTALKVALTERGWSRLTTAQQGQHINDARAELDAQEPRWPYLLTTGTGTAPLVTADMLEVSLVLNTTLNVALAYIDYEDLASRYGDLTQTGTDPWFWYFTPGSITSVSTYPVTTRTIKLVYWKLSPDLSAGADTPLSPSRWHSVIVDIADRNASRNKRDFASAAALQAAIDGKLAAMRTDLLYRQTAGPAQVMPFLQDTY